MGTNYYMDINKCDHCNRYETIHIGKQSMGWKFQFEGIRDLNGDVRLDTITELKKLTKENQIYDEYNNKITYEDFWDMVEKNQQKQRCSYEVVYIDGYDVSTYQFS